MYVILTFNQPAHAVHTHRHGIMVMNTPGGNTVSTAQLAMSLLCALARNIPAADMSIKEVRSIPAADMLFPVGLFIH